mmetsp:Transcript_26297/g.56470  ORF Transcript_26297/g.56470 Transcript_26297/m.56470 type:complete len:997 (-) Transcript_26297:1437-4427(-)|eukprot:CAMPEP_0172323400 /NCGR_PEP_ID=MMETSP1058-20130122/48629_1 /TAXON_ID=83371 /ORGANISM="Detonula confervacea, Strain CCMP 353" /LENGTH=996 /DNA_ID=CAMNT_0013039383 /DNA_START=38 /DNA_END=3028 /DNA_ORIENTATION=+
MCGGHEERCNGDSGCCFVAAPPNKFTKSNRKGIDQRFRDYLVRTNIDVLVIGIFLACYHAGAVYAESTEGAEEGHNSKEEHNEQSEEEVFMEENREKYALLFPWFAEIIGVFVYYFLSRYAHAIPYTAIMFIIGACIGISVKRVDYNAITFSASTWIGIEGEVILLVFLPGLLFLDSYNINVYLFSSSFWQLMTFAFPMVLAGTALTACVGFYIFDYGWSFDLCMTFGAILAATDPVAVAVLLNELGAPPRLKMHVSGESLMNDGSAVVFYHIFSLRFLYEIGIPGVGEDVGWGEGFMLFFRLSLGGACIGVAFGVGLLIILFNLNRRLSGEDSVVQVVATITTAYLVFFTSEILAECSGIIAVLFCGVTVKAFGETLYNDSHLSHHFWEITEYLLNTLLFALGGCVWGDIISASPYKDGTVVLFSGKDWGYLFALYIFLMIIRFFLVFSFYPITARLGIGTNWQEAVFMSYGGLRGAVGIALALSLHAEVDHYTSAEEISEETRLEFREYTAKVFGMVGGIAFLTLIINAPTCGPLLKALGLVTPTETHKKVLENYHQHMIQFTLKEYVALLTEKRFQNVDFTVIKDHIPFLRDTTYAQLMAAVSKHKCASPSSGYVKPNLKHVIPYLYQPLENNIGVEDGYDDGGPPSPRPFRRTELMKNRRASVRDIRLSTGNRQTVFDLKARYDEKDVQEERLMFIKILRSAYFRLIEHGELESRGFIVHSLAQSLEYVEDAASRGLPLADWNALEVASDSWARPAESMMHKVFNLKQRIRRKKYRIDLDLDFFLINLKVRQILLFTQAHQWARKIFKQEFSKGNGCLTAAEKIVMDESDGQVEMAVGTLSKFDEMDVAMVKSHYVCQILLNRAAYYFKKLKKHGLMTEREAGEILEEIEENIYDLLECRKTEHTDEMSTAHKMHRLESMPRGMLKSLNLLDVVSKDNLDGDHDANSPKKEGETVSGLHLTREEKEELDLRESHVIISEREIEELQNAEMPL